MKLLSVLVAVATIGSVHAYFRMECPGRTGLARMDPIVSPGGFSSHAHAVHGSSGKSSHGLHGHSVTLAYSVLIIAPSRLLSDISHKGSASWKLHLMPSQTRQVCILAPPSLF
jgi:hypothetical protein